MRFVIVRNTLYIIIVALFIGLIGLSYKAYNIVLNYKKSEKRLENYKSIFAINNLLESLEKEQFFSLLYLEKKDSRTEKTVQLKRLNVDKVFQQSSNLLPSQVLKIISDNLYQARYLVNSSSGKKAMDIIVKEYQNGMLEPIVSYLETNMNMKYRDTEVALIRLRENINLEKSLLAYSIIRKIVMSDKDLLLWNDILSKRVLPNLSHKIDEEVSLKLQSVFDSKTFEKMEREQRVELFLEQSRGEYKIDLGELLKVFNKKVKRVDNSIMILLQEYRVSIERRFIYNERQMYKYSIAILLVVIVIFILWKMINIVSNTNRERLFLTNTLREIESDLDIHKQKELKELISSNNSIEIYKFLEKEIKEPSRAKDLFLANMSHEIRTPLNGIVGFTKELQQTQLTQEQREMLNIIEESSEHLIHIVNDILDFSKIKAGKIEVESIPFNLIEKVESAIDTFVAKAREKNIELKVDIDPYIPVELLGDPTKILQILTNLISNAIKFTVNEGSVVVSVDKLVESSSGVKVKFMVKDSGIGVESREKKIIFDAFSQADPSTSRKFGGTGLGLSISSQLVKRMGGKLELESEVGKGSLFHFTLNLEKTESAKEREKLNLERFQVAYISPINSRTIDSSLKRYVEYQGAKFNIYSTDTILTLPKDKLPDLLFIDYRCFEKKGEIEPFLALPLKIVLIVAENREEELGEISKQIDITLHKPVNFTRTMRALEVLNIVPKKEIKVDKSVSKFLGMKALVAEDNLINQKLMKSVLTREGIDVTVVNDGKEALKLREKEQYDVIFMDIQMPVMGGVEATEKILELEAQTRLRHVPIIALTANALEGDKEKYLAKGMDAYLSKPLKIEELERVLIDLT